MSEYNKELEERINDCLWLIAIGLLFLLGWYLNILAPTFYWILGIMTGSIVLGFIGRKLENKLRKYP